MDRVIITRMKRKGKEHIVYLVFDEKRSLKELQVFEEENETCLNQIFVGYVEKIVPNISAAFVRIKDNTKCYLPLSDLQHPIFCRKQSADKPLSEGDALFVQVVKDAVKTKDAIVSTKLTLHGLYCFLTTENTRLGVSNKIETNRAKELLDFLHASCPDHASAGYGIVLRTNAQNVSPEELLCDIRSVRSELDNLLKYGIHKCPGERIYAGMPGYLYRLKGMDICQVDGVVTDQEDLFHEIGAFMPQLTESKKLSFYRDDAVSLAALYQLRKHLDELTSHKVWLPSGANIIIECLETLTVIDVNSGKNLSRKDDALHAVNMEAAREICRQIRLRNISGMIIIDFINMKSKHHEQELTACLRQELQKDSVPAVFVDITKLGLVEVTRKKVHKALSEVMNEKNH